MEENSNNQQSYGDAAEAAFFETRDELANKKVDGMTVRELMDAVSELRAMDQRAAFLENQRRQEMSRRIQAYRPLPKNIRKPKDPGRELAVGKYVLTVMAAVLCLGALCVFLAGFWSAMPGILQFALAACLGAGMWAAGIRMSDRTMRPFWLGIAGLGTGVCYVVILAGSFVWYLYGITGAAVLAVGWMLASAACCVKARAAVFNLIAYAGGLMSLALAGWMLDEGPYSGAFAAILATASAGACFAGYARLRRRMLLYAHMAYCMATCGMLSGYDGAAPCLAGLMLLGSCTWLLRCLGWEKHRNGILSNIVHAAVLAVYIGRFAAGYGLLAIAACVAILIACNIGAAPGYAVGTVWPVMSMLSALSDGWLQVDCAVPVAAAVILCCLWIRMDSFERRLAARAAYLYAAASVVMPGHDYWPWMDVLMAAVLLGGLGIWYRCSADRDIWDDRDLEILIAVFLPGFLLASAAGTGPVWERLPMMACVLLMQGWRMKTDGRFDGMTARTRAAWHVLYATAYLALSWAVSYSVLNRGGHPVLENIVTASVLVLATAFLAWLAVRNGRPWQSAAACASSQWHMWAAAGMFGFASHTILLDVAGMALAAGCVALGFAFHRKPLRQCGLACAILYGVKLGLLDVAFAGSGSALGLLVAGGLSFGMSAAYNGLGRKYLRSEAGQEDRDGTP